jgi:hypothetical protein
LQNLSGSFYSILINIVEYLLLARHLLGAVRRKEKIQR